MDDQIHIRAGDTVEWTNQDPVTPHTVTFGTEPANIFLPFPSNLPMDADGALHAVITSRSDSVSSGIIAAGAQDPRIGNPELFSGLSSRGRARVRGRGRFLRFGPRESEFALLLGSGP